LVAGLRAGAGTARANVNRAMLAFAAGLLCSTACASAQVPVLPDSPAPPPQAEPEPAIEPLDFRLPPPDWTVKFEPRVWWVSPNGEVKLPAASGTGPGAFTDSGQAVDVSRLNLDTPRLSAAGEVEIAADRWRFAFSAGGFSLSRDETIADAPFRIGSVEVAPGERLSTRMDYSTFELTIGYEVWSRDFRNTSRQPENAVEANLRVILLSGGRIHDFDIDVESLDDGTIAGTDQMFFEAMGGGRLESELFDRFNLAFQASGGLWVEADRSVFSFDMQVLFRWEPTDHIELEIGWRQILMKMTDGQEDGGVDEFEFTGGMAGLFAGIVVRF
jgi:hypothetical protein